MQPSRRPVILGFDAVSPLGTDLESQWQRLLGGVSGVGPLDRFPLRPEFPVTVAGQVPAFDAAPYPFLGPREMAHWTSPIFAHAMLTVHRALAMAGVELDAGVAPRAAITFSTAVGGLDAVLDADRQIVAHGKLPKPSVNPNSCINMVSGKVSMLTGATGPIVTGINACATGNTSMILGAMLILAGDADLAICGAVDFPLVEPIVAGFATMNGAYKTKAGQSDDPFTASRPFSATRRGFVVAEGSGAIVLASRDFADAHGLPFFAELAGWGMTADAHHYVAPHRPTIVEAMRKALRSAGIAPEAVDAINAHAASTKAGDDTEFEGLREVFGQHIPPVTANKSAFGHAMGASSALESIFALMGLRDGVLPPTQNHTPDPEVPLDSLVRERTPLSQEIVLKNAFGFGGCNACVVLRRVA